VRIIAGMEDSVEKNARKTLHRELPLLAVGFATRTSSSSPT